MYERYCLFRENNKELEIIINEMNVENVKVSVKMERTKFSVGNEPIKTGERELELVNEIKFVDKILNNNGGICSTHRIN